MLSTTDQALLIGFAILMLWFIFKRDKIYSVVNFSLYKRDFSSFSIFCTIVATMIGASGFVLKINLFYFQGWLYLIPTFGMAVHMIILCLVVLPKSNKVLGRVTVSSFMGEHYGEKVRVLTAIASSIGVSGFIASQYKVIGISGHIIFPEISSSAFLIVTIVVVALYSYIGGIRHVIHTDIVQLVCFLISFVVLFFLLTPTSEEYLKTANSYNLNRFFLLASFKEASVDKILSSLLMLGYFAIPALTSTQFQRFAIGTNKSNLVQSWWASSIFLIPAIILPCYLSYCIFIKNPELKEGEIFLYLVNSLSIPGTKGILLIGLLAMSMSTADSHLNTATINIANDTIFRNSFTPLQKLKFAKLNIIFISLFAFLLITLTKKDLLELVLFSNSFYMPIITIPLFAALLDWKTTGRCVLISSFITFSFVVIVHLKYKFEPLIPGMVLNLFLSISTHYIIEKWELFKRFGIKSQLNKGK